MANAAAFATGSFKAEDIPQDGLVLTVRGVESRVFDDKAKLFLAFEETGKTLALNQTRLAVMRGTLGDETDEWIGKQIKLLPGVTEFKGKRVGCVTIDFA